MNEKIIKQIRSLPPLPKSVIEVQRITSDPDSSIADLVKVIKEDPSLTANLLKAANSPLYGFTRQVKNVDQAVALFGMSTVKGFAISFAVRNSMKFNLDAYGISENQFHDVSAKRNAIAINWFKRDRSKLDVMATNSFLIDLGAIIISHVVASEGSLNDFKAKLTPENRSEVEKEFVGATTEEITAEIFKHWNFSEDLVVSMENIKTPENAGDYKIYSAALLVLENLVDLLKGQNEESEKSAIELASKYSLDTDALVAAIEITKG